eukprot:COSAG01_NODE_82_length_27810_cov_36.968352_10_plen_159_part_00
MSSALTAAHTVWLFLGGRWSERARQAHTAWWGHIARSGYKGYGLALMCELIGGVLTGGYTIEPSHFRSEKTIVNSMTAIIIDPAFMGAGSAEELLPESTRLFDYVRSSPTREDDTAVEVTLLTGCALLLSTPHRLLSLSNRALSTPPRPASCAPWAGG